LKSWCSFATNTIPSGGAVFISLPVQQGAEYFRAVSVQPGIYIIQPGPIDGHDLFTTSVYSYAPGGSFPGGGNNDRLRVGGWADQYFTLLQFDLTNLPTKATSVVLYMYCYNQLGGGTTMLLDRVTQSWNWREQGTGRDHDRLWWADRPSAVLWQNEPVSNPTMGQWYGVDITSLYNAWQDGTYPNYGVQFRPVNYYGNNFNEFCSSQNQTNSVLRPKLVINTGN
jgi:hypothetical protein